MFLLIKRFDYGQAVVFAIAVILGLTKETDAW